MPWVRSAYFSWLMVASGLVMPASHSASHANLNTLDTAALQHEALHSKQTLEKQLNYPVNTLIYPYGKGNRLVHQHMARHYPYVMRIGSAVNMVKSWQPSALIYRLNADLWWQQHRKMRAHRLIPAMLKYYLNRWRGK